MRNLEKKKEKIDTTSNMFVILNTIVEFVSSEKYNFKPDQGVFQVLPLNSCPAYCRCECF